MRFFSSLKQRLILASLLPGVLAALLMVLATSWLFFHQLREQSNERWLSQLQSLSELALPLIARNDRAGLQQLATITLNMPTVRSVSILDTHRVELAHAGSRTLSTSGMNWPSADALEKTLSTKPYLSQTEGSSVRYFWPIQANTSPDAGWLDVEFSTTSIDLVLYQIMAIATLVLLIIICVSVVLTAFLFRHSTRSLSNLVRQLEELGAGNFNEKLPLGDNDEINMLIGVLNNAITSLQTQILDMQEHVKHSTQDLRETLETIEVQNIELDLARKEALQASKMKSEFLANTSHEIRTPLNGIIGFTRLLLKNCRDPQQQEYLQTIEQSSEALLAIINDILDLSRMEAGKLVLDYSPFNLNSITEETLQILAPAAHEKTLELTCVMDADMPECFFGDPLRLRQILTNLVGNAIKFSNTGGITVRFSLENRQDNTAVIKCSVSDSGIGISRSRLNQDLFSAFTQGENNQHRQQDGTGLGLAISKKLVNRMGGDIGISSEENIGSTFWFTLKLDINRDGENTLDRPHFDGLSVLLYDSSSISRQSLMHLLTRWGIHVSLTQSYNDITPALITQATGNPARGYDAVLISVPTDHQTFPTERLGELTHNIQRYCPVIVCSPTTLKHYLSRQLPPDIIFVGKPVLRDRLLQALQSIQSPGSSLSHSSSAAAAIIPAADRHTRVIDHSAGDPVLVVDDNPANLKLMSSLLEDLGYEVKEASSGREALALCQQQLFQLIFMDIRMPVMDGVETTQRIRSLPNDNHRVPVIAVTAHALAEQKQQLLMAGLDDYLSKPIDPALLEHILARWTQHHSTLRREELFTGDDPVELCVDRAMGLRLSNGKPDLAADLHEMLLQDLEQYHFEIRRTLAAGRFDEALELVHKLHGAACYCGVPSLRQSCQKLEQHLKTTAGSPAREDLEQFDIAVATLLSWNEQYDIRALFAADH